MRMIILFLVSLVFASLSFSSTIHVPADYRSIQEAIDNSQDGDTVLVAPGTYYESINFLDKTIMVRSSGGADSTVIDGCHAQNVVSIENQETQGSVLEGFTITNGLRGILCAKSSPSILNNIIKRNHLYGGGNIHGYQSSPFVYGNIFINNYSELLGGGLICGGSAIIENNFITQNISEVAGGGVYGNSTEGNDLFINNNVISCNSSNRGGGLSLYGSDNLMGNISNNIIFNNTAAFDGGGIFCDGIVEICNNIILKNMAGGHGGGIYISSYDSNIVNNVICKNYSDLWGGGISCGGYNSFHRLTNNTISGNISNSLGGGIDCAAATTIIRNTVVWENQSINGNHPEIWGSPDIMYSVVKGGWSGPTNINGDPLFIDPDRNDYRLLWRSPCINRGTHEDAPFLDFEGDPRPCMGCIDIGADEFIGPHTLETDGFTLSASTGGIVNFSLNGGLDNASRTYLLLGCVSGTLPGTSLPGGQAVLPLMLDPFSGLVISMINTPLFSQFMSGFDATGLGSAQLNTLDLGALPPEWVGIVIHFAFTLDSPWDFVSNPVAIEIVE